MNKLGIVCPFCPLHCDDISIDSPPSCSILNDALASLDSDCPDARIGQQVVTVDQALDESRQRIGESDRATLLVRSATLGQAKAIMDSGFIIGTENRATSDATQNAIARCGVISATLADIKQHADTLVFLGDIDRTIPRLTSKLGLLQKLGNSATAHIIHSPGVDVNADSIAELAMDIRQGRQFADRAYVAFILDSEALDADQADPAVELLIETIIWMNSPGRETSQRAVLVALDPLASLRCVSAWSGGSRLNAAKPSESLGATIRLGEPGSNQSPADIQIGGADPGPKLAAIYLPASTPGIHHTDAVIRGDGTVTLPLYKIQSSSALSVADWIAKLS